MHNTAPASPLPSQAAEIYDAIWNLANELNLTHLITRADGYAAALRNNTDAPSIFHSPEAWGHALNLFRSGSREALNSLIIN